jgi:hypothetical protein
MDYFEFIESGLGIELNDKLESSCRNLTSQRVESFAREYLKLKGQDRHDFVTPRTAPRFYRPLFDENFLSGSRPDQPRRVFDFDYHYKTKNLSANLNLIYSLLVFSDEIIVRDALPFLLTFFYDPLDRSYHERGMSNLIHYFKWMRGIRPLYEIGKISFYNNRLAVMKRLKPSRRDDELLRNLDRVVNTEDLVQVTSYLKNVSAMNELAIELDADMYVDTPQGLKALEVWLGHNDKPLRRSDVEKYNMLMSFIAIEFPIYSGGSIHDFVSIVRDGETTGKLREFLTKSITEIYNIEDISKGAVQREIAALANEHIQSIKNEISMWGSETARFNVYRVAADIFSFSPSAPVGVGEIWSRRNKGLSHIKAIGYIKDIVK